MPSPTKKRTSAKPSFRVERWFSPSVPSDLDALHTEQLRLVGEAFDGRDLPAAERLFEDPDAVMESEQHFFGVLEWRELVDDATGLRIEAWLASSDAGTYFAAGTTEVFAEMIQECVELRADEDTALARAIEKASRRPIPKSMGARKEAPNGATSGPGEVKAAKPPKKAAKKTK